ncbi:MAG: hypothetical protein QOJ35_543, partial [Solirubrobacteraceae bacterium]|nr:hypothetical protein [Solirubrobacteraceae bacterium]
MSAAAHRLAAGLASAGMLAAGGLTAAPVAHGEAPDPPSAGQPAAPPPPAALLPDRSQPPAATPAAAAPTAPAAPRRRPILEDQRPPVPPGSAQPTTADTPAARKQSRATRPRSRNVDGRLAGAGSGAAAALAAIAPAVRTDVPSFFIDSFRIPVFLLPIYQAAGIQYGVRWEILAAINEIETDYGRNLNVSTAGAVGWMQFMPSTWQRYGVDANKDGLKDPYNPVDAIFAAARYLRAAGADKDVRGAVFAYNHADWYVDSVLLRARLIGGLPSNFVGSLTGLTQARFPVEAKARYAGSIDTQQVRHRKIA